MGSVLDCLCEIVSRHTPDGTAYPMPNVMFRSGTSDEEPFTTVLDPMLCFILQGTKCVIVGNQTLTFGANSVLALSLSLPVRGRMVDGTISHPHLGLAISLDRQVIRDLVEELPCRPPTEIAGFSVTPMEEPMLEPLLRLARLADHPADAVVLAPLAIREIAYRAVRGPVGPLLRDYVRDDGRTAQIRRTADWILAHLDDRHFSVEDLAAMAGMSVRSFHRHFKIITAQSPLQFMKQARLYKARNALMAGCGSVAQTAFAVGYESASQFSREYQRQFGHPPVEALRGGPPIGGVSIQPNSTRRIRDADAGGPRP